MKNGPIKILHVVFSLEPGGMENGVVNLTNALNPAEFDVHICCLDRAGAFADRLIRRDCVHILGKSSGFSWRAVLSLARLISELQPHVLHSHNLGPLIYSSIASGFGVRYAILHGEHSLLRPHDYQPRHLRQRRWLYRCCRRIHTVSTGSCAELVGLGFPGKITAVQNGVDSDRFAPGSRTVARNRIGGLPETALVVGIVGRFGPFKQHGLLIEAFSRMTPQWPDLHLLIVGDGGPERDRVMAQAQASPAAARIHFAGLQRDLPSFYQSMDLLVVPSTNEGMSNAVLEAMACGVPALTHALSGHAEVIRHGEDGWVADLGGAEKLQIALERILADREQLAKMGQVARENVASRFSLKQMICNYASLYRELAGRSGIDAS